MSLTYQTLYFNQTLDHLQPWSPSSPIYSEKYLLNDEHYGGGPFSTPDCPGPIFMYAGNEGPVEGFWPGNGFMQDLAVKYNGLLLFPEQRYYGTSQPTDTSDPSSPWLLTTQQVLEDYVNLLSHVKAEYSAESCPTIAFGGSYGGTLAAFLRSAYPWAIEGALASSSEMGYYDVDAWESQDVDEFTFADIVSAQYAKEDGCLENIWAATDAIEAASPSDLLEAFNFCDEGALAPNKSSIFVYGLEGLAQLNYPYAIGDMPAWPVTAACDILGDASSSLLERAAKATAMSIDYSLDGDCLPSFEEGPGNIPGDGPGLTSWGYQSCTECLHEFSSRGREDGGIRPFV
jgi:lysosomal Pro-X carboxypeptidase